MSEPKKNGPQPLKFVDRESIENLVRYLNEHTNNVRMVHRQSQAQRKSRSNQKEESEEVSD